MTFGSLFAGIGGMDLGLERAGMTCKWQVEINPYCRKVLAKHWPNVRRHDDVRTFPPIDLRSEAQQIVARRLWGVDLIAGGFPCQDISKAGNVSLDSQGIDGSRSGLWGEFAAIVRLLRPRFVLVENVAKLLDRGLGRVLGDLAEIGYDAEWACLPAAAVGACHIRDRLFVLAYPHGEWLRGGRRAAFAQPPRGVQGEAPEWAGLRSDFRAMGEGQAARARALDGRVRQPDALRTGDGTAGWVDRRRGAGNAVYPDAAEWIGRRILEARTPLFDAIGAGA